MLTDQEIEDLRYLNSVAIGLQKGIENLLAKQEPREAKPVKRQNLKDKRVEQFAEEYASGKWSRKTKTA